MIAKNQIFINAEAQAIYDIACETLQWPEILPHYRYVKALHNDGHRRVVAMGARRDGIPVSWTAKQTNSPDIPEIRFTHIAGWTKGMDVVWHFVSEDEGTRVIIEHVLDFRFPIFSEWIGDQIVGRFFVENIATKTLARIKFLAERAA